MAAGFKTATVQGGQVSGASHTDFPVFVDLNRLGVTTLAEAQSIRVYADSGKTTEWAREIVSATEMHVKVPSLTSSTEIYIDWDGVRSDYATTDTYGRNTVWNFNIVMHLENDGVNSVDGGSPSVNTVSYTTGKLGVSATQTDGSNRGFDWATTYSLSSAPISHSAWFKTVRNSAEGNGGMGLIIYTRPSSPYYSIYLNMVMGSVSGDRGKVRFYLRNTSSVNYDCLSPSAYNDGNWHFARGVYNGSTMKLYIDGAEVQSIAASGTPQSSQKTTIGTNWDEAASDVWDGEYDEIRSTDNFEPSADWVATEYNNQNNEAAFWGSWSDAGGGASQNSNFLMFM